MENPGRLVENWNELSKEMENLKVFRDVVASNKGQHMASWLKNVQSKEDEYDVLHSTFEQFKNGSLADRRQTNTQVLTILRSVNVLKEVGSAVSDSIETLFSHLTGEKPRRYSYANLTSFTKNFSQSVGYGNTNVYKGRLQNGLEIVVKKIPVKDYAEELFMAELNTLFKVSHRNLVKLIGYCCEGNKKAFVFEYMPNGSLDMILFDPRQHKNIKWEKLYDIAIGTANAISYLHDGSDEGIILHCISPDNILLDSSFSPKVTNFGISKLESRQVTDCTHSTVGDSGSLSYVAPELCFSRFVTHKCDVFSFGMILFEILGRRRNLSEKAYFPDLVWKMLEKREFGKIMKECGLEEINREKAIILCMVAIWCIQCTPENRPPMNSVVKMLEKEIKVVMPPSPFHPTQVYPAKSFVDVVYDFNSN